MHRDKKVGLALAILLCSIVGAFFFRDDAPRNNGPELRDPQKLDQEIAHGGRVPYSENNSRQPAAGARRTDRSPNGFDQSDLPDFLRDRTSPGQGTAQRSRVNGSRDPLFGNDRNPRSTDPSTLAPPPHDTPAVPIPLHNSEWDVASHDSSTARRNTTDVANATAAKGRIHTVADGETLSSIAGKYLGSQARYQEVFQANRDQLKSPNDLKIGMKLTIPDRTETRSTSGSRGTGNSSGTSSAPAVKTQRPASPPNSKTIEHSADASDSADSTNRKPKFKPAKPSPSIRRTTDASDEESFDKTLSQLPPRELPEIDDGILAELERDLETSVAERSTRTSPPRVAQTDSTERVDPMATKAE